MRHVGEAVFLLTLRFTVYLVPVSGRTARPGRWPLPARMSLRKEHGPRYSRRWANGPGGQGRPASRRPPRRSRAACSARPGLRVASRLGPSRVPSRAMSV